ncbi:hypothetical protein [Geminocystis sp. NIES-3709]|uniref:hypothetical protein n=1 Tax=Geminocystis sp. NIES-3709 TaxID=1617448 RepID=UPI0005FC4567|nr:hypothetical protein [Geminocystis sp. NIES-3709]BAQ64906.1 hypothetical protein GM3709_1671 [Geminocystis sp. NIES-3709]
MRFSFYCLVSLVNFIVVTDVMAQNIDVTEKSKEFDLDPSIIENSPVIRQWMKEIPDISDKITHQPIFPTRYRFGYTQFPSNNDSGGIFLGVEDVFIGNTSLTFSAKYSQDLSSNSDPKSDRLSIGSNLQYYLFPLGSYINIAPVIGYRYIETAGYNTGGVNVGIRLGLIFSPQGAGDIFITQSFVSPTGSNEVGITEINVGYALTKNLRLATEIGWQNSIKQSDSQVSVGFEWIP